jgi:thioredoxin reductase (NADPH)
MAHKLVIIGSGPAGYTAGIYAARADLKPTLFAGREPGGQLMLTSDVENWPGEPTGILGPELMENIKKQAERFGTVVVQEAVTKVDLSVRPFKLTTDSGEVEADAVIISTGAVAKWLGIPGEKELQGKGVSACATCDGFFFRDKKVVVVGGGDAAMEEAIFITKFASEVTVLLRKDLETMRASKIMKDRALANPKIKFLPFTEAKELVGTAKVEGVKVVNNQTGAEEVLPADGFFVAIGHKPNTDLFVGQLTLDDKGYIVREANTTKTSVEGVFAAGDVIDPYYRQAITSAGSGCAAALDAERWIAKHE